MALSGRWRARRGLTLLDTAAGVASLGLLGTLGVTALSHSRAIDHQAVCSAKLGELGSGSAQFALANNGLMAGLTAGQGQTSNQTQHSAQAVGIMRARGRPDMPTANFVADVSYWSLSLVEFQDRTLSDTFNICPRDVNQLKWRNDPAGFDAGAFLPMQPGPSESNKRVPYMSSYRLTAGAFDTRQNNFETSPASTNVLGRIGQNGNAHNQYTMPSQHILGPSAMSLVALPSQKVHVFDEHQRHFPGVNLHFMASKAIQPILFFDGSVRLKLTRDARYSWIPSSPTTQSSTYVIYSPRLWEPPISTGRPSPAIELVSDRYRWTRNGLLGWDFAN